MKPLFSVQRTRSTAIAVLFVWLMSFGIGVANACLAQQDQGPHDYLSQGHSVTDLTALGERQAAPYHLATNSVHSDENMSSPEKITCLHFCVAEKSALITDHLDGLAHIDFVLILFLTGLLLPAIDQTSLPETFASPTWLEPAVSIRFLRLTI